MNEVLNADRFLSSTLIYQCVVLRKYTAVFDINHHLPDLCIDCSIFAKRSALVYQS